MCLKAHSRIHLGLFYQMERIGNDPRRSLPSDNLCRAEVEVKNLRRGFGAYFQSALNTLPSLWAQLEKINSHPSSPSPFARKTPFECLNVAIWTYIKYFFFRKILVYFSSNYLENFIRGLIFSI